MSAYGDSLAERLKQVAAEAKKIGTIYGPAVLTKEWVMRLKYALPLAGRVDPLGFPLYGLQIVEVADESQVMPMVYELRRQGKRPVFIGMIYLPTERRKQGEHSDQARVQKHNEGPDLPNHLRSEF